MVHLILEPRQEPRYGMPELAFRHFATRLAHRSRALESCADPVSEDAVLATLRAKALAIACISHTGSHGALKAQAAAAGPRSTSVRAP